MSGNDRHRQGAKAHITTATQEGGRSATDALMAFAARRRNLPPEALVLAQEQRSGPVKAPPAADPTEMVSREVRLAAMPHVLDELNRLIEDPTSSAEDLAKVISLDTGLSAQLLRVVNSAMYGFPSRIETIPRAVAVLGTKRVSMLALGASVMASSWENWPHGQESLATFWRHGVACGIVARRLAQAAGHEPERFFVLGLLHDVGKLVLGASLPRRTNEVGRRVRELRETPSAAEKAVLGFDHATMGAVVLRKWNFPMNLARAVLYHHEPWKSPDFVEPKVVHVADVICQALGHGAVEGGAVEPLSQECWEALGLSQKIFTQAADQLDETLGEAMVMLGVAA